MKLKGIEFENCFQHRHLKAEFGDFNVILGPNGSGKSSVVEGIRYALTNKFTWPGTLDTMITQGEESGKIKLWVEDEGDEIELVTHLGKVNRTLKRPARDLTMRKSSEIVEYIEQVLLKTSVSLVNEASIVGQHKLTEGLFTTAANRMKAFMRLAGLDGIEHKRTKLADEKSLRTPSMIAFDIEVNEKALKELDDRIAATNAEIAAINTADLNEERFNNAVAAVTALKNSESASADIGGVREELKKYEDMHAKMTAEMDDLKASISEYQTFQTDSEDDYNEAVRQLTIGDEQSKQRGLLLDAVTKRDDAIEAIANLGDVPPPPPDTGSLEDMEDVAATAKAEIVRCNNVVGAFSDNGTGRCPTCSTEIPDPGKLLSDAERDLDTFVELHEEAAAKVRSIIEAQRLYTLRASAHNRDKGILQGTVDNANNTIEAIGELPDVLDTAEYVAVTALHDDLFEQIDTLTKTWYELELKLEPIEEKKRDLEVELAKLTGAVSSADGQDGTNVEDLEAVIVRYNKATKRKSTLEGRLEEVLHSRTSQEVCLTEGRQKAERYRKLSTYLDAVEFTRGVLHRDNFPSGKVKVFIDKTLITTNVYLDMMDAGFYAHFDKDVGFMIELPSKGITMRADRLSGGEQVTFALAFRFAVNEIKSETGFLFLDEPTAYLDDDHIDGVVKGLSLVKEKLSKQVQIFVVTHDEKLAAVADSVLEIKNVKAA